MSLVSNQCSSIKIPCKSIKIPNNSENLIANIEIANIEIANIEIASFAYFQTKIKNKTTRSRDFRKTNLASTPCSTPGP